MQIQTITTAQFQPAFEVLAFEAPVQTGRTQMDLGAPANDIEAPARRNLLEARRRRATRLADRC